MVGFVVSVLTRGPDVVICQMPVYPVAIKAHLFPSSFVLNFENQHCCVTRLFRLASLSHTITLRSYIYFVDGARAVVCYLFDDRTI